MVRSFDESEEDAPPPPPPPPPALAHTAAASPAAVIRDTNGDVDVDSELLGAMNAVGSYEEDDEAMGELLPHPAPASPGGLHSLGRVSTASTERASNARGSQGGGAGVLGASAREVGGVLNAIGEGPDFDRTGYSNAKDRRPRSKDGSDTRSVSDDDGSTVFEDLEEDGAPKETAARDGGAGAGAGGGGDGEEFEIATSPVLEKIQREETQRRLEAEWAYESAKKGEAQVQERALKEEEDADNPKKGGDRGRGCGRKTMMIGCCAILVIVAVVVGAVLGTRGGGGGGGGGGGTASGSSAAGDNAAVDVPVHGAGDDGAGGQYGPSGPLDEDLDGEDPDGEDQFHSGDDGDGEPVDGEAEGPFATETEKEAVAETEATAAAATTAVALPDPAASERSEPLLEFLTSVAPDGGAALMDPSSAQSQAATWLFSDPANQHLDFGALGANDEKGQAIQREVKARYGLATLFYSVGTGVPGNPEEGEKDLANARNWMTEANHCEWEGITCAGEQLQAEVGGGRDRSLRQGERKAEETETFLGPDYDVTEIRLTDMNLDGPIPPEVGLFSELRALDLSFNDITGGIPPQLYDVRTLAELALMDNDLEGPLSSMMGRWVNMEILRLADNDLDGFLPAEIGSMTELRVLDLGKNSFADAVPDEIGDCANLEEIQLLNNDFTGAVPASIAALTKLATLRLEDNSFAGSLPDFSGLTNLRLFAASGNPDLTGALEDAGLLGMPTLEFLYLGETQVSGSIPPSVGESPGLKLLHLNDNDLTGSIPPEIGLLTMLQELKLDDNELTGDLPDALGDMTSLAELYLHNNGLTSLPPTIGGCAALTVLSAYGNAMTGRIPSEVGSLTALTTLRLMGNEFTGGIPETFAGLANLKELDLSENSMNGTLTEAIGSVTSLEQLYLTDNLFTGGLPASLTNLAEITVIYVDENRFSGPLPSNIGDLTKLEIFRADYNRDGDQPETYPGFTGELPPSIGDLKLLEEFHAHKNGLTGPVPAALAGAESLKELRIERNFLTGELPPELGELTELEEFKFHDNGITKVPATMCPLLESNGGELEELETDCGVTCVCCVEREECGAAAAAALPEDAETTALPEDETTALPEDETTPLPWPLS